jgi:hypothetical protein
MRAALLVVLVACASTSPDDQPDDTELPVRSCTTELRFRSDGLVRSVELAGEWDWNAREPLTDPDGDGIFTLAKELPAGIHAYKLVVDAGRRRARVDPRPGQPVPRLRRRDRELGAPRRRLHRAARRGRGARARAGRRHDAAAARARLERGRDPRPRGAPSLEGSETPVATEIGAGAPLLYYGDEYGEHGGNDPDNRHMWLPPTQRTSRQAGLHDRVARVGRLRSELAPLRRGSYQSLTITEDVLAFARVLADDHVIVVINRAGESRTHTVVAPLPDGTLADRMDPAGRTVALSGGQFTIDMPARSIAILAR